MFIFDDMAKLLLILLIELCASLFVSAKPRPKHQRHIYGRIRGNIAWAAATYKDGIDIKKKYARKFDRLTTRIIQQLLCSAELKGLPTQIEESLDNQSDKFIQQNYLEPLFINLATRDGLYGVREFGQISARFRCRHFHGMVIIANNYYYALGKGTTANKLLIERLLAEEFVSEEIGRMQQEYNRNYYCRDFTFLPPEIIRRGKKLLFDLHTLH